MMRAQQLVQELHWQAVVGRQRVRFRDTGQSGKKQQAAE